MKKQRAIRWSLVMAIAVSGLLHPVVSQAKQTIEKDIKNLRTLTTSIQRNYSQLTKLAATMATMEELSFTYKKALLIKAHIETHKLTKKQAKALKIANDKLGGIKRNLEQIIALQPKIKAVQAQSRILLIATQESMIATEEQYKIWLNRWTNTINDQTEESVKIVKNVLRHDESAMKATFIHAIELASRGDITAENLAFIESTLAILDESVYKKTKTKWLMKQKSVIVATSTVKANPTIVDYEGGQKNRLVVISEPGQYIHVKNITVTDEVIVKGGGHVVFENATLQRLIVEDVASNSLHLMDVTTKDVIVNDRNGARIVAEGNVVIDSLQVNGDIKLEGSRSVKIGRLFIQQGATAVHIEGALTILQTYINSDTGVLLQGDVSLARIEAQGTRVVLAATGHNINVQTIMARGQSLLLSGKLPMTNLQVDSNDAQITIDHATIVSELSVTKNVTAKIKVQNNGQINKVDQQIEVNGNSPGNQPKLPSIQPPIIHPEPPVIESPVVNPSLQPIATTQLRLSEAKLAHDIVTIPYTNIANGVLRAEDIKQWTRLVVASQSYILPTEAVVTVAQTAIHIRLPLPWTGPFRLAIPNLWMNHTPMTAVEMTPLLEGQRAITVSRNFVASPSNPYIIWGDATVEPLVQQVANVVVVGNLTLQSSETRLVNVEVKGHLIANGTSDGPQLMGDIRLLGAHVSKSGVNEITIPYVASAAFPLTTQHVRAAVQLQEGEKVYSLPTGSEIVIHESMITIKCPTPLSGTLKVLIAERIEQDGAMSWPNEYPL